MITVRDVWWNAFLTLLVMTCVLLLQAYDQLSLTSINYREGFAFGSWLSLVFMSFLMTIQEREGGT